MQTLVALYHNFEDAQNAVDALVRGGVDRNKISLVANNTAGEYSDYVNSDYDTEDAVDSGEGAAFGAASGGIIGALAGLGALAIPGIGPVIAAGPLIAALTGGAVGALAGTATGGLVAGLVKTHHMDAEDAELYAEGVRRGETLLTVQVEDAEVSRTRDLLNQYNPTDVHGEASNWRSQGWSRFDESSTPTAEEYQSYRNRSSSSTGLGAGTGMSDTQTRRTEDGKMVLPVVEEQVDVSKREVEKGKVHVYTEVTEKPVSTDVTLRQENVTVERRPADRPVSSTDAAFRDQSIELTEKSEQAVINKSARVVEEVVVGKDVTQQSQTVSDTVRRTDVRVERDDSGFNAYDTNFRSDYQTRYGSSGRAYDVYMPAYQYGYTIASDPNYTNYSDWSSFESNARTRWEREHPDTLWDDIKDAVRYAWDTVRGRR
jgi:uncharacterized protein (TIGR02271 family)